MPANADFFSTSKVLPLLFFSLHNLFKIWEKFFLASSDFNLALNIDTISEVVIGALCNTTFITSSCEIFASVGDDNDNDDNDNDKGTAGK